MHPDAELRVLALHLTPLAVRQYAEARGWQIVPLSQKRFWLLQHPEKQLHQLLVPMDKGDPGFADAMMDLTHRLAEDERRPRKSILEDLLDADSDVVRVRVQSRAAQSGSLTLAADVALRDGIRRALLSSACSVISPATFHPRLTRTEAVTLLAACRAGQTEVGSYVVKVACPLYAVESAEQASARTFTRFVTEHLMSATAALVSSIEGEGIDSYLESQKDEPFVSANLCEALLQMVPSNEEGRIELSTVWASDPKVPRPADPTQRIGIDASYAPEIERAANKLRPGGRPTEKTFLVGTVETLNGELGPDNQRSGEVFFSLFVGEEQIRARANLSAADYSTATTAHREGQGYVMLRAVLHRGRRTGRLEEIDQLTHLASPVELPRP